MEDRSFRRIMAEAENFPAHQNLIKIDESKLSGRAANVCRRNHIDNMGRLARVLADGTIHSLLNCGQRTVDELGNFFLDALARIKTIPPESTVTPPLPSAAVVQPPLKNANLLDNQMNITETLRILRAIADGADPDSGEELPKGGFWDRPRVVRALFSAISTIEKGKPGPDSLRRLPEQHGKGWTEAEDAQLDQEFESGIPVNAIAANHRRTRTSIRARLVTIGKIADRFQADAAIAKRNDDAPPALPPRAINSLSNLLLRLDVSPISIEADVVRIVAGGDFGDFSENLIANILSGKFQRGEVGKWSRHPLYGRYGRTEAQGAISSLMARGILEHIPRDQLPGTIHPRLRIRNNNV